MIFCFGSLLLDRVLRIAHLPLPGEGLHASEERWFAGGEACHVGGHLAAWGEQVTIAGNDLGADEAGAFVRHELERRPRTTLLTRDDPAVRTPSCTVLLTPDAERTMIVSWPTKAGWSLPEPGALRTTRLVSASIYGPGMAEMLALARGHNIPIAIADVTGPDDERLPGACIVTTSRSQLARHGVRNVERWIGAVHKAGGAFVAVSDGPLAVLAVDEQGRRLSAEPLPIVPVDSTGAGDALKAGLIYGRLAGWQAERSLRYAVATAGLQCLEVGAFTTGLSRDRIERAAAGVEVRPV